MLSIDTGWPPPELLVIVSMQSGTRSGPFSRRKRIEALDIHVALEGPLERGLEPFSAGEIDGRRARPFDVRSGRVEVGVARDEPARRADDGEEDLLRRASLVRREEMLEGHESPHGLLETVERMTPGVGLVGLENGAPLARAHGGLARVGQQVDEDVVR
jgi:hypothetical protein